MREPADDEDLGHDGGSSAARLVGSDGAPSWQRSAFESIVRLGDDLSAAVPLQELVEVDVVRADSVHLHLDATTKLVEVTPIRSPTSAATSLRIVARV